MCVCVYIYTHIYTYIHIYKCIHVYMCVCMCVCTHTYTHTHTYIYIYTDVYPHIHIHTFYHIYTFILFTKLMASSNSTGLFSSGSLISYPFGKKVLKPKIKSRCPLNSSFTLIITPLVSILSRLHRRAQRTKNH